MAFRMETKNKILTDHSKQQIIRCWCDTKFHAVFFLTLYIALFLYPKYSSFVHGLPFLVHMEMAIRNSCCTGPIGVMRSGTQFLHKDQRE